MMTSLLAMGFAQLLPVLMVESPEIPSIEDVDNTPQVFVVTAEQKRICHQAGAVCMSANGGATMEAMELTRSGQPLVILARGARIAATNSVEKVDPKQSWEAQMVARFKASSVKAPVIVAIFDRADPESIAQKEAKVMWTVVMQPGRDLGLRFALSPEDGFAPSHTYYLRVVQTERTHERLLAEGDFRLE